MEPNSTKVCIAVIGGSTPSSSALAEGQAFGRYERFLIKSSLEKAGINPMNVHYALMDGFTISDLNSLKDLELVITLGESPLRLLTGKKGIDKWNMSPLDSVAELNCPKVLPTFDVKRINKQYEYRMFFFQAFSKAGKHQYPGPWKRKVTGFQIETNPTAAMVHKYLKGKPILSVDIETSRGTINTMGFAWSPSMAVAFQCEPGKLSAEPELAFWKACAHYLEDPKIKKILQNNVYEATYFSRYGINMTGVWHDTMWGQKLLYPEFKMGLDIIGQLQTNELYWKEDGKDWGNINNWKEHLIYNCKDTTGTMEAALNQRKELEERGMLNLYDDYLIKLSDPLNEMCSTGLRVDTEMRAKVSDEVSAEIVGLAKELSGQLNHRSPKQKIALFTEKGYEIPKKRKPSGKWGPSADELSLKKMRLAHPDDKDIEILLKLAKLEKFLSNYIDFDYHDDGVVRYTLFGTGTETLRFSGKQDSWSMGFNPQTIPKKAKKFFLPPEGCLFIQADLGQAESRYVAYRSNCQMLIQMLEDPSQDVHSYVASKIFDCSVEQVLEERKNGDESKRQLGKKSGHGANYSMQETTFQASCLKDDLILTTKEAKHILETYHGLFPELRQWHNTIREEVKANGYLENPLGFRRHFWGRPDESTFREAFAFEPQSTIPMITNHLLLYLYRLRAEGTVDCNFHLQVHDSVVLSAPPEELSKIIGLCKDIKTWAPKISFPAGDLWIPVDVTQGTTLGNLD